MRRAFTMVELLVTIVIIAVIAIIATAFVGDYVSRARLTAARHTVATLNEALNEYRTLGGLGSGYGLNGSSSSTLNAATLTTAAIEAMQTGFTNFGRRQTFVRQTEALNTAYIGSTGSGKTFRFVLDETNASAGTTATSTAVTLTLSIPTYAATQGLSTTVKVTASQAALNGRTVTLNVDGSDYTATLSSTVATFTIPGTLPAGSYTITASTASYSVGSKSYPAATATSTLNVFAADIGVGSMAKASAGTYRIYATTTTGYMAFKDASGTVSIKSVSSLTSASLASSLSYTFWSCAGASDSTAAGNLTFLWCPSNSLTSLDVSNNTALTRLQCSSNALTSLDVSKNTALTDLGCNTNSLTSFDVSKNTALAYFYCYSNQLTSLDVSNNTALATLNCAWNSLTSLDVSANTALTQLQCESNSLTSLDVSNNTALTYLQCESNALTSLDVSNNTALTYLWCYSNSLTSLDVSANTALTNLRCYGNTSLVGSANALQTLYNGLPTFASGTHTIYIGTAASTDTTYDSIATAKKWTIRRTDG